MIPRILTTVLIFAAACEIPPGDEKSVELSNMVREEWPNGNPKLEIPMKGDKKHGVAKSYYESGIVRQEIEYQDGVKHGKAVFYYEDGNQYRVSQYHNDKLHGIRKTYRENGALMAEIPYNHGENCKGLKEYLVDGSLKKRYPKIKFREVNEILTKGMVTLVVSLTEKTRKVQFYRGPLGEGGCYDRSIAGKVVPQKKDELRIYFPLPKGTFVMQEVKVFVKVTTNMGNPYIVEGSYNLAAENR